MRYDISKRKAPEMPNLGKGTECIKLLLSQASKDMHEPLVPMFFPVLGAHISGAEFQYPDLTWKEMCGQMAHLVADSGNNKGQLGNLVEAICRDFRQHDEEEMKKLVEWARLTKTRGANKEKPARPDTASHMLRNIYDRAKAGAMRATADGVTGNPILRVCMTISSTPVAARGFYKNELFNGTFGRMVFSYKPRGSRSGRIPRQGQYSDEFYKKLDEYLARLDLCKGRYVIRPLNKLADKLAEDMASMADLIDDDVLWDMSKRALVSAWKAGCILWALNGQTWTRSMGEVVEWLLYRDIWSKLRIFSDMLKGGDDSIQEAAKAGPKNMLDSLPNTFNEAQLEALRLESGKSKEGTKNQLRVWVHRKFITYSNQTGLYTKTEEYLKQ